MPILTKFAALVGAFVFSVPSMTYAGETSFISIPVSDLQWHEVPDMGGEASYADLRGSIFGNGPYEAFLQVKAGVDNPYHTHSRDVTTVVLKGIFYIIIDGKRIEYPAGSFWSIPADLPHYSGCAKGDDCLMFIHQVGSFDIVPLRE